MLFKKLYLLFLVGSLTHKLYNFSSYNGVVLTISLVSLPVAKRWWQQSYALSSQEIVKRFSEKTNDLVRLQHIASAWYSLESVLHDTHMLFKEYLQKQMYDHLVWFAATVVESKLKQCSH